MPLPRSQAPLVAVIALFALAGCGGRSPLEGAGGTDAGQQRRDSGPANPDGAPAGQDARVTGDASVCQTIPQAVSLTLPRVSATGDKAGAVWKAIEPILSAQTPAIASAASYTFPSVACANIDPPMGASGYQCNITIEEPGSPDGGTPLSVGLARPSTLAENLMNAIAAAGAKECGPMGIAPESEGSVSVFHVVASATSVSFDDASQETFPPSPSCSVDATHAAAIVGAFAAAGIDDCDPGRSAFLICNRMQSAPTCGVQWFAVDPKTGLVSSCSGGAGPSQGPTLTASQSQAVWDAVTAGAASAGFKPLDGTVAEATVLNASYFVREGTSLGFQLTLDDPSAPPPPAGDAAAP